MKDIYQNLPNGKQLHAIGKYAGGRAALLCLVALSFLNLVITLVAGRYLGFSACVPRLLADLGADLYQTTQQIRWPVLLGLSGMVSILPYLLCYFFSKQKRGWMIAALVIFSIDTVFLLIFVKRIFADGQIVVGTLDYLVHTWVIVELSRAVKHGKSALSPLKETEKPENTASLQNRQDER